MRTLLSWTKRNFRWVLAMLTIFLPLVQTTELRNTVLGAFESPQKSQRCQQQQNI